MALQDPCCPVYPDDWVCEKLGQILGQYQHSPKLKAFIQAGVEQLDIIRCVIAKDCDRTFDCTQASGAELDAIGLMVGFPRCHCNVICDPCAPLGMSDYCLDDDLYCRFIQAQLITNRGGCSLSDMEDAIQALWGDDAAVVFSGGGSVAVWPGRELTDIEKRLYGLYRKVLPLCLGVNLVIYDSGAVIPAWCCGTQLWCDVSMGCELQDCTRLDPASRVGPVCPEDTIINCEENTPGSYTSDIFAFSQNTDVYPGFPVSLSFMGLPPWVTSAVDNGDGTFTISYDPPAGNGSASFMVMAITCPRDPLAHPDEPDLESTCTAQFTLLCMGNNDPVPPPDLTINCGGDLNQPPVAPANITVDCGVNSGPTPPPDITIDCGNNNQPPIAPPDETIDCGANVTSGRIGPSSGVGCESPIELGKYCGITAETNPPGISVAPMPNIGGPLGNGMLFAIYIEHISDELTVKTTSSDFVSLTITDGLGNVGTFLKATAGGGGSIYTWPSNPIDKLGLIISYQVDWSTL